MPDEPSTPDDREADSADIEDEYRNHELTEAEADFLADRDPEDYPSVLCITSNPEDQHRQEALDGWSAGRPARQSRMSSTSRTPATCARC